MNIADSSSSLFPNTTKPRYIPTPNIDGTLSLCHNVLPLSGSGGGFVFAGACLDVNARLDGVHIILVRGDSLGAIMSTAGGRVIDVFFDEPRLSDIMSSSR